MAEENLRCSKCGEEAVERAKVCYGVFIGGKQPYGICKSCGAPYWRKPEKTTAIFENRTKTPEKRWDWHDHIDASLQKKKRRRRRMKKRPKPVLRESRN